MANIPLIIRAQSIAQLNQSLRKSADRLISKNSTSFAGECRTLRGESLRALADGVNRFTHELEREQFQDLCEDSIVAVGQHILKDPALLPTDREERIQELITMLTDPRGHAGNPYAPQEPEPITRFERFLENEENTTQRCITETIYERDHDALQNRYRELHPNDPTVEDELRTHDQKYKVYMLLGFHRAIIEQQFDPLLERDNPGLTKKYKHTPPTQSPLDPKKILALVKDLEKEKPAGTTLPEHQLAHFFLQGLLLKLIKHPPGNAQEYIQLNNRMQMETLHHLEYLSLMAPDDAMTRRYDELEHTIDTLSDRSITLAIQHLQDGRILLKGERIQNLIDDLETKKSPSPSTPADIVIDICISKMTENLKNHAQISEETFYEALNDAANFSYQRAIELYEEESDEFGNAYKALFNISNTLRDIQTHYFKAPEKPSQTTDNAQTQDPDDIIQPVLDKKALHHFVSELEQQKSPHPSSIPEKVQRDYTNEVLSSLNTFHHATYQDFEHILDIAMQNTFRKLGDTYDKESNEYETAQNALSQSMKTVNDIAIKHFSNAARTTKALTPQNMIAAETANAQAKVKALGYQVLDQDNHGFSLN